MSQNGWHRVDPADVPDDGRVRSVVVDGRTVALSRCGSRLGALENRCPHQDGPLGEGSIEKGLLRCPWHGYDYDPLTGKPPEGFSDGVAAYRVDERADGVYVQLPPLRAEVRTDHAELAALAVKHAIDGRGVAHLVLPDEVQVQPSAAVAARPDGRLSTRRIRPDDAALSDAAALVRDARA
ncbi:MAG: Rieske 2Fe-2S domain-containing protein [Pseudonocardiaceae bacterium]